MNQLENKVALVTGATSGIGRATALLFAREGAKVVAAGRRVEQGEALVREIEAAGGEALFVRTDVADEAAVQALVQAAVERFGRIDIVFNNAGVEGTFGPAVHESTTADYEHLFRINVQGAFWVQKYTSLAMLASGGGAIVNTSSVAGHTAFPGSGLYAATKHAVEAMTEAGSLELAKQGIRVNAVAPALIETEMAERAFGAEREGAAAGMHPLGRIGRPEEVAEAVLFLASDRASFITGVSLPVDGGFLQ